jgi:NifU-like protein involved in Fe-S cluster formation
MPALEDLYSQRILELAGNTPAAPRLAAPQASVTLHSKLCGSTVTVDLIVRDGRVAAYGHTVKACLLGQASAAIMAEHSVGATPADLRAVASAMRQMLKAGGPPPEGDRWADLAILEPIRDFKARHASTLLVFDAIEKALDLIDAQTAAPQPAVLRQTELTPVSGAA